MICKILGLKSNVYIKLQVARVIPEKNHNALGDIYLSYALVLRTKSSQGVSKIEGGIILKNHSLVMLELNWIIGLFFEDLKSLNKPVKCELGFRAFYNFQNTWDHIISNSFLFFVDKKLVTCEFEEFFHNFTLSHF